MNFTEDAFRIGLTLGLTVLVAGEYPPLINTSLNSPFSLQCFVCEKIISPNKGFMPLNLSRKNAMTLSLDAISLSLGCCMGGVGASTAGVNKFLGATLIGTTLLIDKLVASQFNKFIKPPQTEGYSRSRKIIVYTAYGMAWGASKAVVVALAISLSSKIAGIFGLTLTAATFGKVALGLCKHTDESTISCISTVYCVAIHTIASDIRAEPGDNWSSSSLSYSDSEDDFEDGGIDNLDEVLREQRAQPEEQCTVCRDQLDEEVVQVACTHLFHRECISTWLIEHARCPNCRFDLRFS